MSFWSDERAAAVQVGAIVLFAFVVIAITAYQASVVPDQNEEIEFNHNAKVQGQLQELQGAIRSSPSAGDTRTVTVELSTSYPPRTIFVNPPKPTGRLETLGTTEPGVAFEVQNAAATNGDVGDYWDGRSQNYSTGGLAYTPNYHVYSQAPTTFVENSLVYNRFADQTLTVNSQSLFDGDQISLIALHGSMRQESGTASVDVKPLSTSTKTIEVESDGSGNVTITTVSQLSPSRWRTILDEEGEFADQDGYVYQVIANGTETLPNGETAYRIDFEMTGGETYTLQLARVGVGKLSAGDRSTNASYAIAITDRVTTEEDANVTITAEVRDQYNNPKSGVSVNATATGSANGNVVESDLTTNEDGRVTFTYNTTTDVSGSSKEQDEVRMSFTGDPTGGFDETAPENVTSIVTVKNTDGSGTGGGGGGGAYSIEFDKGSSYNWDVSTQGSTLTLVASTDPALEGVSTDFAVNNSSVATIASEDSQTNSTGEAEVMLDAQKNGTVGVYVGSSGSSDVINVTVTGVSSSDTTPPTFSSESPTGTVSNDQPTMSVDISDPSGVDSSSIAVTVTDGAGTTHLNDAGTGNDHVNYSGGTVSIDPTAGSSPFSLAEGTTTVTVEAADNEGNTGSTTWQFTVDTGGPAFSNEAPTGTVSNDQPTMSVDISDPSGVDSSSIAVTVTDGAGTTHLNDAGTGNDHVNYSGGTVSIDPTAGSSFTLADGDTTVTIEARDEEGNLASTTWTFTVDTTGPALTNPTPDGTTVPDDQQVVTVDIEDATSSVDTSSITVTVSDADGTVLSNVGTDDDHVSYSGGTLTIDPSAGSTPFTYANGTVSVSVSASDDQGNGNSIAWSFTVDAAAPNIEYFNVVDNSCNSGPGGCGSDKPADFDVTWNLTDNENVESYTVYVNKSGSTVEQYDESTYSTNTTVNYYEPGGYGDTYTIKVIVYDAAGNGNCSVYDSVTADGTDPSGPSSCGSSSFDVRRTIHRHAHIAPSRSDEYDSSRYRRGRSVDR